MNPVFQKIWWFSWKFQLPQRGSPEFPKGGNKLGGSGSPPRKEKEREKRKKGAAHEKGKEMREKNKGYKGRAYAAGTQSHPKNIVFLQIELQMIVLPGR